MVCRARRDQPELIELTSVPGAASAAGPANAVAKGAAAGAAANSGAGKKQRRGGRAARDSYVCMTQACLAALAARQPRPAPGEAGLLENLAALGRTRFLGMLGLARRQGELLLGADRIAEARDGGAEPQVYVAEDAAERTAKRLRHSGEVVALPLPGAQLGRAVGCGLAAAVGIVPGRLGQRAAYWQRVWYEAGRQLLGRQARTNNIDIAAGERLGDDGRIEVA